MKVKIGPYRESKLSKFFSFLKRGEDRNIKIHIDDYDVWSMDHTLAMIILPMLKKLKEQKHGSCVVDLEDVPEHMRNTEHVEWSDQLCFDFYHGSESDGYDLHDRWDWILDEMIWAFEQIVDDNWEEQYWIVNPELDLTEYPEDEGKDVVPVRWKVQGDCDWEGRQKHQDRISNGLKLFGKYYQGLWD